MAQQTAVEWLGFELNKRFTEIPTELWDEISLLFIEAKQMEKKQIDKAHHDGYYREDLYDTRNYYNDTYGK